MIKMDSLEKLAALFRHFPGIGPRQARRFVYFLLGQNKAFIADLVKAIENVRKETVQCQLCRRFVPKEKQLDGIKRRICSLCRDPAADSRTLMVVEKDIDLENIARAGEYRGRYFVLGGLLPVLEEKPEEKIRVVPLLETIKNQAGLEEIILALSANPAGDNTVEYLKERLSPIIGPRAIKLSVLGRGLSTGTELEYSDAETIRSALKNRA